MLSPFNARLNHRRKAAGFILRMFQLHDHRPREENAMFRSPCLNRQNLAKIGPFPGCTPARPLNPSEAFPFKKTKIPHIPPPDADKKPAPVSPPHSSPFPEKTKSL